MSSIIEMQKLWFRDCATITWAGGSKIRRRWGIGENDNNIEGVVDVKFNPYRGGITFSFFFVNWKSGGRVIRVQI